MGNMQEKTKGIMVYQVEKEGKNGIMDSKNGSGGRHHSAAGRHHAYVFDGKR